MTSTSGPGAGDMNSVTERFDSRLAQICSLDVDKGIRPFRMTSVICTIGTEL